MSFSILFPSIESESIGEWSCTLESDRLTAVLGTRLGVDGVLALKKS